MTKPLRSVRVFVGTCAVADDRKTVAAVRSLGRAGARVTVGSDSTSGPPQASRHCSDTFVHPPPTSQPDDYVEALAEYFRKVPHDVLMPLSDETTDPVAARIAKFEGLVRLAIPPEATLRRAFDKLAMLRLAESLGIETPMTRTADTRDALEAVAVEMRYPCIVKPRRGSAGQGFRVVHSAAELLRHWDDMRMDEEVLGSSRDVLVQERIRGKVHDVCMLCDRGRALAGLTQRRLVMWPPRGGVGVLVETTRDPGLLAAGRLLMSALEWHGPGQVEMMVDERDGKPKLIEVNGRFWGSLDLAIQAGVDFPVLACLLALGRPVTETFEYRKGLRYRWPFPRGVRYIMATGDVLKLWALFGPVGLSDIRFSDPLPSWYELWK